VVSAFAKLKGRVRSYSLILLGVLVGVLLGPAFQPAPTSAVTTYARSWSCQGADFLPVESGILYGTDSTSSLRWGSGEFQCDADIPNKATVTKVRFTVLNNGGMHGKIYYCYLGRTHLEPASVGSIDYLATVGSPTSAGAQRLVNNSPLLATIDRSKYAYFLRCSISGTSDEGIYGADVTYTITAANG